MVDPHQNNKNQKMPIISLLDTSLQGRASPRMRRAYTFVCSTMVATNAGVKNIWNRPRTEMAGLTDGIGPTSSLKAATFTSLRVNVQGVGSLKNRPIQVSIIHKQYCVCM